MKPSINNLDQAHEYLRRSQRAWKYLLAVQSDLMSIDDAAGAMGLDKGDFFLLQEASYSQCKAMRSAQTVSDY